MALTIFAKLFLKMRSFLSEWSELLKLEHSLLALPFAFTATVFALGWEDRAPRATEIFLVVVAMVAARTAGMCFNRVLDADFDKENARTRERAIAAGRVSPFGVWALGVGSLTLLSLAAYFLNPLAFYLSFLCHILLFSYSLTKRFTWGCHFFLGVVEAFAPLGGWIAITGSLNHLGPWALAGGTITWFAGLDIVYATQDTEFDKDAGLYSVPAIFGEKIAFYLARACHFCTLCFLFLAGLSFNVSFVYWSGLGLVAGLFIYQHLLVGPNKKERLNLAFFGVNTWISFALFIAVLIDQAF